MIAVPPPTDLPLPREAPPSLRVVAKAAGVSAMTVSRVLRDHPKVSAKMRAKVLKVAQEIGYRPDPHVAKLMHHLRLRRKPAFQASICAITNNTMNAAGSGYSKFVLEGVKRQAEARGYGFSTISLVETNSPHGLERTLLSRGVEGVVLLPMADPTDLTSLLDWNAFSIVSTTSSVLAPEMHCAMPHHFKNMQMLCRQLEARGYRRIGLALARNHVDRVYQAYNAAVTWHSLLHHGTFVPPLIYQGPEPANLKEWFAAEKPDVIVTHIERLCYRFAEILRLRIGGEIGFASTNTQPDSACTGIDELPLQIGATAIDLLTGMVQRGEKGVPLVPASTLLLGQWVEGASCPSRVAAALPTIPERRMVYLE
jgi:DNA-binding LacI/PurR family transcriptional regulator